MQRIGRLAACAAPVCPRRSGPTRWGQTAEHRQHCATVRPARPARPFSAVTGRRFVFAGEKHRLFSSQPGAEGPGKSTDDRPVISVVGIPDPIALIRCKIIMFLLDLYFELNMNSAEFERGVKQALVHVSNKMSRGRYHELKGLVSAEMMAYVEKRCSSLTETQRKQLSVATDDIIFVLPEDISVVHDKYGRKFCFIVMRFWLLSSHEGPDDPEALKIFKVASTEDGTPQKKIATAVYEFHGEVKRGASPDWTVTTVWHWHWNLAA